jgi:hypothetical protein
VLALDACAEAVLRRPRFFATPPHTTSGGPAAGAPAGGVTPTLPSWGGWSAEGGPGGEPSSPPSTSPSRSRLLLGGMLVHCNIGG